MKNFELREAVVYKKYIYNPGDEANLPKELVESLTEKYAEADKAEAKMEEAKAKLAPAKKKAGKK